MAAQEDVPAQYWTQLWRIKWMVAGCAAAGIGIGLLAAAFQTPLYRTKAVLELQTLNQNYLDMKSIDPVGGNDSLETFLQTQIQLLSSQSLLSRTVEKLQETNPPAIPVAVPAAWKLAGKTTDRTEPTGKAAEKIARELVVKGSGLTRLVEIVAESPHPGLAADFANTLAAEYIEQNMENRWDSTKKTGEFLTKKVAELRGRLEGAEQNLQAYAQSAQLVYTSDKDNVAMEQLRRLEAELSGAHVDRVTKQTRYEQALSSPAESLTEVMENADVRENRAKLGDLRRQLAALSTTMTAEHPQRQKLEAQIASLTTDVQGTRENVLKRIKNEYEQAQRRERMLFEADMQQRRVLGDQLSKETRYNLLKREVDSTRLMYDSMLQKLKEVGVAGAMPVSGVRIVDSAKPPQNPALPSVPLNAVLGLVFGALAGMIIGFVKLHSDRYLRVPGEAGTLLAVPEIGAVPSLTSDPTRASNWLRKLKGGGDAEEENARAVTVLQNPNFGITEGKRKRDGNVDLALVFRDRSVMAEAYRGALPAILFANEQGTLRTLVVTSANPREGKTSTVSNLAIGLADLNKRVLLIDGDVRSPRLHEVFGLSNEFGLADLLEHSQHDPKLAPIPSGVDRLFVLPVGKATEMTKNLLHSPKLVEILKQFEADYDIVLIDTAPALHMRDARLLGSLADGVVLIVRAGQTSRDAASAVIDKFRQDGTPVLGVILNDWKPDAGDSVYGKEYMNGYRQYFGH
jgi:succinoglycan biosynthesis transport protein ExoP